MENLFKDIRYGLRGLWKRKGFAAIAVLTLALGIGANTAIFTLINAVMLKSLPVEKPEELVIFNDTTSEGTSLEDRPQSGVWQRCSCHGGQLSILGTATGQRSKHRRQKHYHQRH